MRTAGQPASDLLPIIISTGPRSLPIAVRAANYYNAGLPDSELFLMRPRASVSGDPVPSWLSIIDDEEIQGYDYVRTRLLALSEKLGDFHRAPGWYLQQYLKLACARQFKPGGAIITDGDTIFSTNLLASLSAAPKVLTTNEKFENYNKLVDALGIVSLVESCVANGNVFYSDLLPAYLAEPTGFIDVVERFVIASGGVLDFSEYQLMGSAVAPAVGTRKIKMFRRFDLFLPTDASPTMASVERALAKYDAIAIEHGHRRSFPKRLAATVLFALGYSW